MALTLILANVKWLQLNDWQTDRLGNIKISSLKLIFIQTCFDITSLFCLLSISICPFCFNVLCELPASLKSYQYYKYYFRLITSHRGEDDLRAKIILNKLLNLLETKAVCPTSAPSLNLISYMRISPLGRGGVGQRRNTQSSWPSQVTGPGMSSAFSGKNHSQSLITMGIKKKSQLGHVCPSCL